MGAAFISQKVVAEDWQSVYRAGNGDGPEKWMARPRSERYDLSWGELQLTAEYAGIVACPVFHPGNGKIIGCVAVTAPTTRRRLVERSMLTILRNLAHSVALLEVSR
ncbi:hypothetical protein GCM10023170_092170 [Phytohabitans houttuyneae]|uniref:IclR-ED domain-containing protein n=1 Tax=Phytohabitans houttuyneae TaxID=1076126 RepID=A0A6V8K4U5_9ACTN|nr:hypothetical protein Phou_015180 [Phytohabitans houttuyneae]